MTIPDRLAMIQTELEADLETARAVGSDDADAINDAADKIATALLILQHIYTEEEEEARTHE